MLKKYQKSFFMLAFLLSWAMPLQAKGDLNRMDYSPEKQEAIFAMGCFWSAESAFEDHETSVKLPGIVFIKVGYTGGTSTNPTYENHEGHKEAVKIVFDPQLISYEQLLDIFWHNIDPYDNQGQFCDQGFSYAPAIFFQNDLQRQKAEQSKAKAEKNLGKSVMIPIQEAMPFYEAEEYHQDFKLKNPKHYDSYRKGCGRDRRLKEIWNN